MIRGSADLGVLLEYEAIFYEANAWLEFVLNLFEWLQTGNVSAHKRVPRAILLRTSIVLLLLLQGSLPLIWAKVPIDANKAAV
ncbi:hypothetical protein Pyn_29887 [Prunus yedoensis var. nudiflora]|uniref:Uncharacterized protein n=1 Tax=Prunus yedoensis var. nudiflora TaxID=2094558 RepID=A0A314YE38_PRUYE|nr:hypothetical protein Pyn_29887 [Prunus yedoensis var. nudiflora]